LDVNFEVGPEGEARSMFEGEGDEVVKEFFHIVDFWN
jgi:hypothetical protein